LLYKVKTSALKSCDLFELKNGNKDFILSHEPPNVFIELSFGFGLPACQDFSTYILAHLLKRLATPALGS